MGQDFTTKEHIFHQCPECGWHGTNYLLAYQCPMCKQGGDRVVCEASTFEIRNEAILVNWTDPFGQELNLIHNRKVVYYKRLHSGDLSEITKLTRHTKDDF